MWHELRILSYVTAQTELFDKFDCRKHGTGIKHLHRGVSYHALPESWMHEKI